MRMPDSRFRRPLPKEGQPSKAEKRSGAEDLVAAFLAKGGSVNKMPSVEPTAFACATCGHAGIMGFAPGKTPKCPKCRSPLT
jgi:hypothetical protein